MGESHPPHSENLLFRLRVDGDGITWRDERGSHHLSWEVIASYRIEQYKDPEDRVLTFFGHNGNEVAAISYGSHVSELSAKGIEQYFARESGIPRWRPDSPDVESATYRPSRRQRSAMTFLFSMMVLVCLALAGAEFVVRDHWLFLNRRVDWPISILFIFLGALFMWMMGVAKRSFVTVHDGGVSVNNRHYSAREIAGVVYRRTWIPDLRYKVVILVEGALDVNVLPIMSWPVPEDVEAVRQMNALLEAHFARRSEADTAAERREGGVSPA